MAVDTFEVVLLTAGSRNGETELEPYTEAAKGKDAADDPEEQGYADGARGGKDARRR